MPKEKFIIYDDSGTILRCGICGVGGIKKKKRASLPSGEHIKKITGELIFMDKLDLTHRVKRGITEDKDKIEKVEAGHVAH